VIIRMHIPNTYDAALAATVSTEIATTAQVSGHTQASSAPT
jgi:hypothetical protein